MTNLLLRAKIIKNITKTCREHGVSRTAYNNYRKRYVAYGIDGLRDKDSKKEANSEIISQKIAIDDFEMDL